MADVDIAYDPITVNGGPITIGVNGLDNIGISVSDPIKTESTLKTPDTLKSDGKFALSFPDPITSASKVDLQSGINLQPVVLDQCLRISLGSLPPTEICLPNHQHVGFSLFGVEIVGVTLNGEARILVGEPQKRTRVFGRSHAADSADGGGGGDIRIRLGS